MQHDTIEPMFLRPNYRHKDGKDHTYWSLVEMVRMPNGPRQRTVCYLGELNHSAQARWLKAIEVLNEQGEQRQLKLFPSDVEPPENDPEVVRVRVNQVRFERVRQFGTGYVGLELWKRLGRIQARHPQVADLYTLGVTEREGRLAVEWKLIEERRAWCGGTRERVGEHRPASRRECASMIRLLGRDGILQDTGRTQARPGPTRPLIDRGRRTMNLEQLKEKARAAGYAHICLDADGAQPVSLAQWRGVATGETWGTHQGLPAVVTRQVVYHLDGNKVRAKRAGEKEYYWYVLT